MTVVAAMELSAEGIVILVQDLVAYFYTYDRLVSLQRLFDVLADLFNRVSLHTNVHNTVIMAFRTCHTPVSMS